MDFSYLYRAVIAAYAKVPKTLFAAHAFPPVQVIIELTRRCNLRCAMCQNLTYIDRMSAREEKEQELTLEELERHGVELIDHKPRVVRHGRKIAFLRPHNTHGVLIELVEKQQVRRNDETE